MAIDNIPEIYMENTGQEKDLFVYDFRMTNDVVKSKVNLSMNMFSFLQEGKKQVHFADATVMVHKEQSLLIKKGNWLWTELLDKENIYYCKLLFFSENMLRNFLDKYALKKKEFQVMKPFFIIENDGYIADYLNTISRLNHFNPASKNRLLRVKFEEILLYLLAKYGLDFELYLHSLIATKVSSFKTIVESNVSSNLKLEEVAFLCNMSLSTFKRHFIKEYGVNPGKWLQDKRLDYAKKLMKDKGLVASEVYFEVGYTNLSNFSNAFKTKFGFSPREISKNC
ncbi:MAG: AraC family transcriptional regulator [Flavobacteriaceae bacterium]|nr:AraC family transcriptional regulator [Flavobacteriaceae bacterium]